MIDSMMNFGVSCGDLTSPQFIKNTEDKRPFTQNSLNSLLSKIFVPSLFI